MHSPPRNFFLPSLAACAVGVVGLLFWFSGGPPKALVEVQAPGLTIHRVSLVRPFDGRIREIAAAGVARQIPLKQQLEAVARRAERIRGTLAALVEREAELTTQLGGRLTISEEPTSPNESSGQETLTPAQEAAAVRAEIRRALAKKATELGLKRYRPPSDLNEPEVWLALFRRALYGLSDKPELDKVYDEYAWAEGLVANYRKRVPSVQLAGLSGAGEAVPGTASLLPSAKKEDKSEEELALEKAQKELQTIRDELAIKRKEAVVAGEDRRRFELLLSQAQEQTRNKLLSLPDEHGEQNLLPIEPGGSVFVWEKAQGGSNKQLLVEARAQGNWYWAFKDATPPTKRGEAIRFLPTSFRPLKTYFEQ